MAASRCNVVSSMTSGTAGERKIQKSIDLFIKKKKLGGIVKHP